MFTFKQYCESETSNCSRKYFWMCDTLYNSLSDDERKLVHADDDPRLGYRRCWYPASNYISRPMSTDERKRLIMLALSKGDMATVTKLGEMK